MHSTQTLSTTDLLRAGSALLRDAHAFERMALDAATPSWADDYMARAATSRELGLRLNGMAFDSVGA